MIENGGLYRCPSCSNRLIAHLGSVREHHFKHHGDFHCSTETYLHLLAKRLFKQSYDTKAPFLVHWQSVDTCTHKDAHDGCFKTKRHTFDLLAEYPILEVEKRDNGFVPDILLSNEAGDKIYIEFANTHYSSNDKIRSGAKIIEISLSKELDIEDIVNLRTIDSSRINIELYNFAVGFFDWGGQCICPMRIEINAPIKRSKRTSVVKKNSPLFAKGDYGYHYVGELEFLVLKSSNLYSAYIKGNLFMDAVQFGNVKYEIYMGKHLIGIASTKEQAVKIAEAFASESDNLF